MFILDFSFPCPELCRKLSLPDGGQRGCPCSGTLFIQGPDCLGLPLSTVSYHCDKKNTINNNNDAGKAKGSQEEGEGLVQTFAEDLFPFPKPSWLHAVLPVELNLRVCPLPRVRKRRERQLLLPQDVLTSWRFSSFTFSLSMTCKAKSWGQDRASAISIPRKNLHGGTPLSVPVELEIPQ